jgi:hypothetical protein
MDPISLTSSLSGMIAAQGAYMDVSVATLNKTNDVAKMEGDAMVQMLNELSDRMLDIYA